MSDCVFCDIVESGKAENFNRVSDAVVSFTPLNPVTPGHRLFVTVLHHKNAGKYGGTYNASSAFREAAEWGEVNGEEYNIITSAGTNATQTVFHTHLHYIPRRKGDGLLLPWSNQAK